jgi:hypothetical protein
MLTFFNACYITYCKYVIKNLTHFSPFFEGIISQDWEGLLMVLLDRYKVLDITIFFKSLTYLKFLKYSTGRYHICTQRHWVGMMCQGAPALRH